MVCAKNLEPEDSEVLKISNLVKVNTVLWRVKGKKYTTTIVALHGNLN